MYKYRDYNNVNNNRIRISTYVAWNGLVVRTFGCLPRGSNPATLNFFIFFEKVYRDNFVF